jgi:sulfoquinovosidase
VSARLDRACLLALSLALACSPPGPPPIPPASYVLSDATRIEVRGDGSIALFAADGRALAATAPGAFVTARTFDQTSPMTFGFFRFTRTNEVVSEASRFVGSEQEGDTVRLRFEGDGGARVSLAIEVLTPGVGTRLSWTVEGLEADSIAVPFACDEAASFAGFGEQYNGTDQRGEAFPLWTQEQGIGRTGLGPIAGDEHTTYFPMPWWIDWRGFGVMVDTSARTLVDLCAREDDVAWIEVEDGAPVEALVLHGPSPADLVEQLGDVVGRPTLPPDWAFSPWIGMQGGRDEVMNEVLALEAADVPFSAIWVQDWIGGRQLTPTIYDLTYRWVADETLYPDLAGMITELHDTHGVRFLAYANTFVIADLDHFAEMEAMGLLLTRASGETYTFAAALSGTGTLADLTNPATRSYILGFLRAMVSDYGIDGWMADFGEWLPTDAVLHEGDARLVHNLYPALWHETSRAAFDELRPDGDWVVFSRSGWLRDHEVAQVVWIGDQEADFEPTDGLPTVVPAMLNLGLSGIPFVTHDIAGYSGGPSDAELYARWTELGAFTPIFRTHEGLMASVNWSWDHDAETTAHFRRFARIHEALAPRIRELAREAAATSVPIVRHLAFVFPEDAGSRAISDEMMLGDDLLVAPVVTAGATSREVYFPPGVWFDVWTGTRVEGPTTITIAAPIGSPPVFSRGADRTDLRAIE